MGDLKFHHCIPLNQMIYDIIYPDEQHSEPYFIPAYKWFEKEVGFYPVFLAVGSTTEDIRMTGYMNNWRRIKGNKPIHRNENLVLLSFGDVEGVFSDYDFWHIPLNMRNSEYPITEYERKLIFKKSWNRSRWINYAKKSPHRVQLCTPLLDLRRAARVWVRNRNTREVVEEMGFTNVHVQSVSVM